MKIKLKRIVHDWFIKHTYRDDPEWSWLLDKSYARYCKQQIRK